MSGVAAGVWLFLLVVGALVVSLDAPALISLDLSFDERGRLVAMGETGVVLGGSFENTASFSLSLYWT